MERAVSVSCLSSSVNPALVNNDAITAVNPCSSAVKEAARKAGISNPMTCHTCGVPSPPIFLRIMRTRLTLHPD
jgi:hypothetical protein